VADPNIPQVPLQDNFNLRNDALLLTRLQMGKVINGNAGTRCKIVFYGDSNFVGTNGAGDSNNYAVTSPAKWFMYWLNKFGCPAQQDNCFGMDGAASGTASADERIVFLGGASPAYGLTCIGGFVLVLNATGNGVAFTPITPATYDHVDIWYWDGYASTVNVYLNGSSTSTQTITGTGTGNMVCTTVAFTAQSITTISVIWASGTACISGIDFWNSVTPSVEVINGGISGAASNLLIPGATTGCNPWASLVLLAPTLVYSNFSNNDFNNQTYTPAQVTANYKSAAAAFQAASIEFWPIIAAPYISTYYPSETLQWIPLMHEMCLQNDLPLCNWTNRYGQNASLVGNPSNLHSPYYIYEDIGRRLATLLFFGG